MGRINAKFGTTHTEFLTCFCVPAQIPVYLVTSFAWCMECDNGTFICGGMYCGWEVKLIVKIKPV